MASTEKTAQAVAAPSPAQYRVTRQGGTERAGTGPLPSNRRPGLDVDIVSGEPLFASAGKYRSGRGWSSFTRPGDPIHVTARHDASRGMVRTDVRSAHGDSHLGHVVDDSLRNRVGLRSCITSASRHIAPRGVMEAQGRGAHLDHNKESE